MAAYDPSSIYQSQVSGECVPRVFIAPQRYIQGPGVIDSLGRYMSLVGISRLAILISERGRSGLGPRLVQSLKTANVELVFATFGGECSLEEIEKHQGELAGRVDGIVAVGGGKCVDAGKSIAFRMGIPVVIVPTLASNDAPCSALSVLYAPTGAFSGFESFPQSPALVVVDTAVVAAAPERYLVSGMGDAMATWYEAAACLRNPNGVNVLSARPTLASTALGEICAHTLFEQGVAAANAVRAHAIEPQLENVVEANTLLSGLGFESGGVAVAHGIAQTCTALPWVDERYLHGEMVAIGTLVQLALEERLGEAAKVAQFFARVGLPAHLDQLSLDVKDSGAMSTLIEGTMAWPFTSNMPFAVDAEMLKRALQGAHEIGLTAAAEIGDTAYRRLHAN